MRRMVKSLVLTAVFVLVHAGCTNAQMATAPNGERYLNKPFVDDFDGTQVNPVTWMVATWSEHGGQCGKERCFVQDGNLVMQFINDSSEGFLSSAIQTRLEYFYGKWEYRAKCSSVPGVLNSFYTIDWDNTAGGTSTKQEIDIEFLTKSFSGSNGQVHYALHASGKTSWDTRPDVSLGFNPSADFHTYGFDITPEYISWFADSTEKRRYTYAGNPIAITAPYQLKLNFWSAVSWIGGPPPANVVCEYLIDWIKFTPYDTTGLYDKGRPGPVDRDRVSFLQDGIFNYYLARGSEVVLDLFSVSGGHIDRIKRTHPAAGAYRIDLRTIIGAPGVFITTLVTNNGEATSKWVMTK